MDGGGEALVDLASIEPGLRRTCAEYLVTHGRALDAMREGGEAGLALAVRRARVLDGLLGALYCAADGATRAIRGSTGPKTAVLATGALGRGAIAPTDDLEIVVVTTGATRGDAEVVLHAVSRAVEGHLELRGRATTVEALERAAAEGMLELLDARHLAGDRSTSAAAIAHARGLNGSRRKMLVTFRAALDARRRIAANDDVIAGPGGLADLAAVTHVARLLWGVETVRDAVAAGRLSEADEALSLRAADTLWRAHHQGSTTTSVGEVMASVGRLLDRMLVSATD